MIKIVEDAMDKAMHDFVENNEILFNNEKETLKYKYEAISELKKWNRRQVCIVEGCESKSIKRSHTIQKSGSIKSISENGHVLTPRFNRDNEKIELKLIGVTDASTFPGYCKKHEKLFKDFEQIKDFRTGEHIALQIYRTVCREIVQTKFHIKMAKDFIDSYKSFRDIKIKEAVMREVKSNYMDLNEIQFQSLKFESNDHRLTLFKRQLKGSENYLNGFLNVFHKAILNDLQKNKFQKLAYKTIVIGEVLPIALAGRGNFHVKLKTKIKEVEVIYNVLPFSDRTYILIFCLKKFTKELNFYMRNSTDGLHLINLVESWMIHGSDHWFLKPSIWEKIDKVNQEVIINSIWDTDHNIGSEFHKSIFNDLKLSVIRKVELNPEKVNELYLDFILKEKEKITLANN